MSVKVREFSPEYLDSVLKIERRSFLGPWKQDDFRGYMVRLGNWGLVVVADGKVNFENETMSPSMAAKLAVKRLGYNWSAVSGSDFWKYEDETLSARRLRFEEKPES